MKAWEMVQFRLLATARQDRSNHGQDQWETVGRKKQTKALSVVPRKQRNHEQ